QRQRRRGRARPPDRRQRRAHPDDAAVRAAAARAAPRRRDAVPGRRQRRGARRRAARRVSSAAPRADARDSPFTLLLGLMLALFATLLVRSAWICDDAYITFRVIDNFWNGYGLRWNVIDRVQAYTHPLWLMLMSLVYGVTREAYYTSLALQIALSLAAAWALCFRIALSPAHALLSLWALVL